MAPVKDMVSIDSEKMRRWISENGLLYKELSDNLGMCDSFMSRTVASGKMARRKLVLLCHLYNLPTNFFDPVKQTPQTSSPKYDGPWSLWLVVKPDRVQVAIRYNGEDIYKAWSYVRGSSEFDLVQAVSYATHMCYKQAEQKKLGGK